MIHLSGIKFLIMELKIENLSKTYGNGVRALQNVNLEIPQGMFGLLGPNGAGKSSLMRTIATLQEADQGSVTLGDIDVLRQKNEVRKLLGYLPQEFGVYPRVSAEMMLDHIASLKGVINKNERKQLVAALLQKVNLYDVRKKNLGTYSGGMLQRFGIAQALLGNPRLIIVDEPTAGLDPTERNRFHNLLSEIGENTIVILSTHIVDDVSNLCNNMAIINKGQVIASGNPAKLMHDMEGKIWKVTAEKDKVEEIEKQFTVISSTLSMGRKIVHVVSDSRPAPEFEEVSPSLEDVYFSKVHLN